MISAARLPEREGGAFDDGDGEPVGKQLLHGRIADPGVHFQLFAGLCSIKEEQRGAPADAGDRQDLFARKMLVAGDGDRGDTKADRVGRHIAAILEPLGHGRQMPAMDDAEGSPGRCNEDRRGDDGEAEAAKPA